MLSPGTMMMSRPRLQLRTMSGSVVLTGGVYVDVLWPMLPLKVIQFTGSRLQPETLLVSRGCATARAMLI